MTSFIYNTASTLNGIIATEDNSLEWLFQVPEEGLAEAPNFMDGIGALVSGSTTYEWVLNHENLIENPEKWKELFGEKTYFVFSSRELEVPQGAKVKVMNGNVQEFAEELKNAAEGKDIWIYGGGELAGKFYDAKLLDKIIVSIAPVTLQAGALLLPRNILSSNLSLVDVKKYGQFAELEYLVDY